MTVVLVSGAANGLGAAFVDSFAVLPDNEVIAIDRQPFQPSRPNVTSHVVDLTDEVSVEVLSKKLDGKPIDLVIHSAGIRGLVPDAENQHPDNVAACETLSVMDLSTLMNTFQINTAGTFIFIRALLPHLKLSSNPKVIVMSSRMGSIGNNDSTKNKAAGSAYAYRASKAALNTIIRSFAIDVPQVTFVLVHPGRVETGLVRCKEDGAISTQESISTIMPLIDRWGAEETGRFFDRLGQAIEW
ncbi:NAD(P)-binding protein [Polychaeton citri CBS 116435]|uniref:NAD(P)-binding protein n=1 Tax=Polychaeton citri CBS 116435 TaxID=1314669 RepID=A0A9P4PZ49_9PEZI|nr:NAD(P)-binding protein [Polychaeton citri CBS 116435]